MQPNPERQQRRDARHTRRTLYSINDEETVKTKFHSFAKEAHAFLSKHCRVCAFSLVQRLRCGVLPVTVEAQMFVHLQQW